MTFFPFKGFYPFAADGEMDDDLLRRCCDADVSSLRKLCSGHPNDFSVVHLNCRSVMGKMDDTNLLLSSFANLPDLLFLSETWLTADHCFSLQSYCSYHNIRTSKVGGGVSICVKQGYESSDAQCMYTPTTFEYVARVIRLHVPVTCIVCIVPLQRL